MGYVSAPNETVMNAAWYSHLQGILYSLLDRDVRLPTRRSLLSAVMVEEGVRQLGLPLQRRLRMLHANRHVLEIVWIHLRLPEGIPAMRPFAPPEHQSKSSTQ